MAEMDSTDQPQGRTCDWLLQTWRTFGFDETWRVCWLAKELLASQDGLYSMELSSQSVGYLSLEI